MQIARVAYKSEIREFGEGGKSGNGVLKQSVKLTSYRPDKNILAFCRVDDDKVYNHSTFIVA